MMETGSHDDLMTSCHDDMMKGSFADDLPYGIFIYTCHSYSLPAETEQRRHLEQCRRCQSLCKSDPCHEKR